MTWFSFRKTSWFCSLFISCLLQHLNPDCLVEGGRMDDGFQSLEIGRVAPIIQNVSWLQFFLVHFRLMGRIKVGLFTFSVIGFLQ